MLAAPFSLLATWSCSRPRPRVVVEVPSEVQALRQSQEMVAVYQFLLIFHQSVGVNFDDKTPEVSRAAWSLVTPTPSAAPARGRCWSNTIKTQIHS